MPDFDNSHLWPSEYFNINVISTMMMMMMKVIGCIECVGIRWLCQANVEIKGLAKTALILIIAILIIFLLLLFLIIIIIVIVIIIFIIIILIAENPVTITYILSVTSIYNLRCYIFSQIKTYSTDIIIIIFVINLSVSKNRECKY